MSNVVLRVGGSNYQTHGLNVTTALMGLVERNDQEPKITNKKDEIKTQALRSMITEACTTAPRSLNHEKTSLLRNMLQMDPRSNGSADSKIGNNGGNGRHAYDSNNTSYSTPSNNRRSDLSHGGSGSTIPNNGRQIRNSRNDIRESQIKPTHQSKQNQATNEDGKSIITKLLNSGATAAASNINLGTNNSYNTQQKMFNTTNATSTNNAAPNNLLLSMMHQPQAQSSSNPQASQLDHLSLLQQQLQQRQSPQLSKPISSPIKQGIQSSAVNQQSILQQLYNIQTQNSTSKPPPRQPIVVSSFPQNPPIQPAPITTDKIISSIRDKPQPAAVTHTIQLDPQALFQRHLQQNQLPTHHIQQQQQQQQQQTPPQFQPTPPPNPQQQIQAQLLQQLHQNQPTNSFVPSPTSNISVNPNITVAPSVIPSANVPINTFVPQHNPTSVLWTPPPQPVPPASHLVMSNSLTNDLGSPVLHFRSEEGGSSNIALLLAQKANSVLPGLTINGSTNRIQDSMLHNRPVARVNTEPPVQIKPKRSNAIPIQPPPAKVKYTYQVLKELQNSPLTSQDIPKSIPKEIQRHDIRTESSGGITTSSDSSFADSAHGETILFQPPNAFILELDQTSRSNLLNLLSNRVPPAWNAHAYHTLISRGLGSFQELAKKQPQDIPEDQKLVIGNTLSVKVESFGISQTHAVVCVSGIVSSIHEKPIVVVAVAPGAPLMEDPVITNMEALTQDQQLQLTGIIREIPHNSHLLGAKLSSQDA
eukprot:NODE_285_length_3033_cov_30.453608_g247_i0.p1 GENE.NODE_285_length_3033_cov_30.453608_g247_i0~~NODE_285_length_3033_cov_30.453608_g247_i0.p1  ORF type:complete len:758 (+),score=186.29 NODE_285_length_3033_cov_30.453608_g247_i0:75-2348(+)